MSGKITGGAKQKREFLFKERKRQILSPEAETMLQSFPIETQQMKNSSPFLNHSY
jgi:hypothetical protein